jgi:hypothetical protein
MMLLPTQRDLDVVGGSIGALAAAGGVAALIAILCSNGDESCMSCACLTFLIVFSVLCGLVVNHHLRDHVY